jgi:hypothetical protein
MSVRLIKCLVMQICLNKKLLNGNVMINSFILFYLHVAKQINMPQGTIPHVKYVQL